MKFESFNFNTDEYAAELASQSHQTLLWLNRNGYLDNEHTEDLLSRMVVVPIRNSPKFGQRLLDRFFKRDNTENCYVFPITLLDEDYRPKGNKGKPKLEVIKGDAE